MRTGQPPTVRARLATNVAHTAINIRISPIPARVREDGSIGALYTMRLKEVCLVADRRRRGALGVGIAIARGRIGAVGASKSDGGRHGQAEDHGDCDNFCTHWRYPCGDRSPDRAKYPLTFKSR